MLSLKGLLAVVALVTALVAVPVANAAVTKHTPVKHVQKTHKVVKSHKVHKKVVHKKVTHKKPTKTAAKKPVKSGHVAAAKPHHPQLKVG